MNAFWHWLIKGPRKPREPVEVKGPLCNCDRPDGHWSDCSIWGWRDDDDDYGPGSIFGMG